MAGVELTFAAAARSSPCTWTLIAFIGGRFSRMVATPSATCTFTKSLMQASSRIDCLVAGRLVLERQCQPHPVCGDPTVLDCDILTDHLGYAQLSHSPRGGLHRVAAV